MQKTLLTTLLFWLVLSTGAQSLGGSSVFNFLRYAGSPQLTALGGINISQQTNDLSLSFHNPALLRASMHAQWQAAFSSFPGGVKNYNLQVGHRWEKISTNIYWGVNYFNYGTIAQTDAAGNRLGEFRPSDYVLQSGISRRYGSNWHYGAAAKFIYSAYGPYRAAGFAVDAGLSYTDTAHLIQASLVLKNMGVQVKAYDGAGRDDLPFDLQMGISKKLEKAPLQFSVALHHLHRFNIVYNDTLFNSDNGFEQAGKGNWLDKVFRHFVFSTQLFIGDKIEISAGYNYLRRKELNIGNAGNGLNGFSMGVGILLRKIQIRYARTYYQASQVNNQFGLGLTLNSFSSEYSK